MITLSEEHKPTILAALNELRSMQTVVACLPVDHPDVVATDAAIAALNQPAEQGVGVTWMPFDIVDDDIFATDIKGRDMEPVKVLVTVAGELLTMRLSDSDTPFLSWQLKDHIRLCRLVTTPQAMPMPEGVHGDIEELGSAAAEMGGEYAQAWARVQRWLNKEED